MASRHIRYTVLVLRLRLRQSIMTPPTLEPSSSNSSSDPAAVTLNGLETVIANNLATLTGTSAQARLESAIAGLSSQTAQDRAQNARFQQDIRRRLDTVEYGLAAVETIAAEWQQLSLREPARLEHPQASEVPPTIADHIRSIKTSILTVLGEMRDIWNIMVSFFGATFVLVFSLQ
ncbi:hypothetical protein CPB85DRAFT_290765 [Mucidula mucida]|nr:hypothetical protein CPB85DRAFT_290765 [Mucidula mucida]